MIHTKQLIMLECLICCGAKSSGQTWVFQRIHKLFVCLMFNCLVRPNHACLLLRLIVVFVGFISHQIYQISKDFGSCLNYIRLCLLYFMTKISNFKGLHIMPKVQTSWTFDVFFKIVGPRIFKSSMTLKNFSSMFIRFFTSWLTLKNFRDP